MGQCAAITARGKPCEKPPIHGSKYCHVHLKQRRRRLTVSLSACAVVALTVLSIFADVTGLLSFVGIGSPLGVIQSPTSSYRPPEIQTVTVTPGELVAAAPINIPTGTSQPTTTSTPTLSPVLRIDTDYALGLPPGPFSLPKETSPEQLWATGPVSTGVDCAEPTQVSS